MAPACEERAVADKSFVSRRSSKFQNPPVEEPQPATNQRVPHISLVFREMWDTTDLDWQSLDCWKM
jgi:hypothetical protein